MGYLYQTIKKKVITIVSFKKAKDMLFEIDKRFPKYNMGIRKSYEKNKRGYESFSVDTASNTFIMFHHFPKGKPRHNKAEDITLDIETEYRGKWVSKDIKTKTSYVDGIERVLYRLQDNDRKRLFKENPEFRDIYYRKNPEYRKRYKR